MAKTSDAVSMPEPCGEISSVIRMGRSVKKPHRPYIIDGIPASKSVTVLNTDATFVPLKYSPTKSATGSEKGMQKTSASKAVISVPVMNGKAPYSSAPSV